MFVDLHTTCEYICIWSYVISVFTLAATSPVNEGDATVVSLTPNSDISSPVIITVTFTPGSASGIQLFLTESIMQ